MGFLDLFGQWLEKRNEKRIEFAKSQGTCPECQGKGVNLLGMEQYTMSTFYVCSGCSGSGSFSDWVETN
ncbi:methionine aminopeptidase [Halalkalibacter alkalisediminis]|uniref:Methionine aminopeptidase n=1 Tax=Halalkalibacter alkalisediminis TaxID=935616 RepID=A0ABV6NNP1_9BACI|nr:methionine aminopeptidase [Halalkalibacter alkalisediminis]